MDEIPESGIEEVVKSFEGNRLFIVEEQIDHYTEGVSQETLNIRGENIDEVIKKLCTEGWLSGYEDEMELADGEGGSVEITCETSDNEYIQEICYRIFPAPLPNAKQKRVIDIFKKLLEDLDDAHPISCTEPIITLGGGIKFDLIFQIEISVPGDSFKMIWNPNTEKIHYTIEMYREGEIREDMFEFISSVQQQITNLMK